MEEVADSEEGVVVAAFVGVVVAAEGAFEDVAEEEAVAVVAAGVLLLKEAVLFSHRKGKEQLSKTAINRWLA